MVGRRWWVSCSFPTTGFRPPRLSPALGSEALESLGEVGELVQRSESQDLVGGGADRGDEL
jgi:hypothetical protein